MSRRLFPTNPAAKITGLKKMGGRNSQDKESGVEGSGVTDRKDGVARRNESVADPNDGLTEDWSRHPAKTSQVNEYENISPTPSTDF